MNREQKRMLKRQGSLGDDGNPVAIDPRTRTQPVARRGTERTSPATFLKEVRGELRRVAWPSVAEIRNYSTIVLATLAVLITIIFILDFAFAKSILFLFDSP